MNSGIQNPVSINPARNAVALLLVACCTVLCGCGGRHMESGPYIEVTRTPPADPGGPEKLDVIEGYVVGARPNLRVVLFARSGAWYVQPFADEPFTQIRSDSKWRSSTHLGTEYAALLVEPGFEPPSSSLELPGKGGKVIGIAIVKGEPVFWRRWWFLILCVLALMSVVLAFYSYRLRSGTRHLNKRFEERLAERSQIPQELHDTLLQGVISASMQLHVAVDRLPEDLPVKSSLTHVLQVMAEVIEDGRRALQSLCSTGGEDSLDMERAFYRIRNELDTKEQISLRVTVDGRPRSVHPIIRDEVYRIGRAALVNAFRHSGATCVEVAMEYKARYLRVNIRDDGCSIDSQALRSAREGDGAFSAMRERAQGVGGRLKVRSSVTGGTEVELSIPGDIAFQSLPSESFWRRIVKWHTQATRPGVGS